jgi:hypothetical protein
MYTSSASVLTVIVAACALAHPKLDAVVAMISNARRAREKFSGQMDLMMPPLPFDFDSD